MTRLIIFILSLATTTRVIAQSKNFITTDIDNFWAAYDKISSTNDSIQQYVYLKELYFDKATAGLKSLLQVRNYSDKEFIGAINSYPKFWTSIRKNTLTVKEHYSEIESSIENLRTVYPSLKPSTIYFAIGAFRTGGTTQDDRVMIACELSFADKSVFIDELPAWLQPFYRLYDPINDITLLCTHEYVHTQQKAVVNNLLCNSLREGVAEFVSCLVTDKPSNTPSFEFASKNEELVRKKFIDDVFIPSRMYNWIWGENKNELKERDLGYYIGYRICENYYNKAKNKQQAINDLIELDYSNEKSVETIIDRSGFFNKTIKQLNKSYDKSRPKITNIEQFKNGSVHISPNLKRITLHFSTEMNKNRRGFDYGPLGGNNVLLVKKAIGFSEDGKSFTFEVELKPNTRYQSLVTNNFVSINGVPLKPFLIDIRTTK
ncbi:MULTISPECIES: hypothetical protein [Niastella]|uniref:DUF2268 domain-containing protein n=1 Tax=Niastella soli TaxID=2821487 RepID=A0ABS3Z3V1_9BACT|nr:hypothetical protein [Niastella soli]MBO9204819.1 hypothetical protein [Niastella soli]